MNSAIYYDAKELPGVLGWLGKDALWPSTVPQEEMGAVLALAIRLLPSGRLCTLALVLLGISAYAAFAHLTGALTRDDLAPLLRRFGRGRAPKKED